MAEKFSAIYPQMFDATTGKPAIADSDNDFDEKIFSNQYYVKAGSTVPMIGPDGKMVQVPIEKYQQAKFDGLKFHSSADQFKDWLSLNYGSASDAARAALEGAFRGATLGISDFGARVMGADTQAMALRKEANPLAATSGEWAAILGTALLSGGTTAEVAASQGAMGAARNIARLTPLELSVKAGSKVAKSVEGLVGASESAGLAKKILQSGVPKLTGGAVAGGLMGAGMGLSEASLGDHELNAENIMAHVGPEAMYGAIFGAGIETAIGGLSAIKNPLKTGINKASDAMTDKSYGILEMMFGTPKHIIEKYVKDAPKIKEAPPIEELINKTASSVAEAKELQHQYSEAYKTIKDNVAFKHLQQKELYNAEVNNAKEHMEGIGRLKDDSLSHLTDNGSNEMVRSVDYLNGKFESHFAGGELEKALEGNLAYVKDGKMVNPTEKILKELEALKNKYQGKGQEAKSFALQDYMEQIDIADKLGTTRTRKLYSKKVPGEKIEGLARLESPTGDYSYMSKKYIRGLIEDLNNKINWKTLGGDGPDAHRFRAEVREIFSNALKEASPEYKAIMEKSSFIKKGFEQGNLDFEAYGNKATAFEKLKAWAKNPEKYSVEIDGLVAYEKHLEQNGFKFEGPTWSDQISAILEQSQYYEKIKSVYGRMKGTTTKEVEELQKILSFLKDPKNNHIVFDYFETEAGQQAFHDYYEMMMREFEAKSGSPLFEKMGKSGTLRHDTVGVFPQTEQGLAQLFKKVIHKDPKIAEPAKKIITEFLGQDALGVIENAAIMDYFEQATFRNGSSNPVVWKTIVGAMTGLFGGGGWIGAAAGGMIGKYIDVNGPKIVRWMLDNYATMAAVERMGIENAHAIDKSVAKFLGVQPGEYLRSRAIPMAVIPDYDLDKKLKERVVKFTAEDYARLEKGLSTVSSNPMAVINHIGSMTSAAAIKLPKTKSMLSNKATGGAIFLNQKLPKNPIKGFTPFKGSEWRPSDAEMRKFARYYKTVVDPISAFEALAKGTLTNEHVETLKTVYPKLYSSAVNHIVDQITDHDLKLSSSKKLDLSMFLGQPITNVARPQFIASLQTLHGQANMAASNQPTARPSVKMAEAKVGNMMSATDSTINRA